MSGIQTDHEPIGGGTGKTPRPETIAHKLGRTLAVFAMSALAVLTVGSVLALVTDTVSISGAAESNDWTSNTTTGQPPDPNAMLDLRVKVGTCDPADDPTMYSDDATFSTASINLDLAAIADAGSGETGELIGTYCLYNASSFDGAVSYSLLASSSFEVGDCDVDELAFDATCAAGDPGELDTVTFIAFSDCGQSLIEEYDFDADGIIDYRGMTANWFLGLDYFGGSTGQQFNLDAGQTCQLEIGVKTRYFQETTNSFGSQPDESLMRALSDSLQFDFSLDLEEF